MAKTLKAKDIEALENTGTLPIGFAWTGSETMNCPTLSTCQDTLSCPSLNACVTFTGTC